MDVEHRWRKSHNRFSFKSGIPLCKRLYRSAGIQARSNALVTPRWIIVQPAPPLVSPIVSRVIRTADVVIIEINLYSDDIVTNVQDITSSWTLLAPSSVCVLVDVVFLGIHLIFFFFWLWVFFCFFFSRRLLYWFSWTLWSNVKNFTL